MKCVSLWQPYATMIMCGAKQFETRTWAVRHRGPILIHAAKAKEQACLRLCLTPRFAEALLATGIEKVGDLPFGAILGTVSIIDCRRTETVLPEIRGTPEESFGDYMPLRFAWRLTDPQPFAEPLPWRGSQGLFEVPERIIEAQTARAEA